MNAYASTELGSSNTLVKKEPADWAWYFFHPDHNGFDFRPVAGQADMYELFVKKDPTLDQQVFRLFPELDEWPMKDLFAKHPTKPHHWRLEGRSDDLIVFAGGSKLNPRGVETALQQDPNVNDVLLLGTNRHRPAAIIEPTDFQKVASSDSTAQEAFLDKIWPTVEASNRATPLNAQLARELMMATKSDKPFPRSGKGTIQRGTAADLYKDEIEGLYQCLPPYLKKLKDFRIGSESTAENEADFTSTSALIQCPLS